VGLHDLVNDGQPQAGAAFKVRLERLKDLFDLLRAHASAGIGESDLPIVTQRFERNRQRTSALHGANRIFTEIPEYLLELVPIGNGGSLAHCEAALNRDSRVLRGHAVIH